MLKDNETCVFALGGLEEVGLNALVVETAADLVLVDCGLSFPGPDHVGCDYLIPDFRYLEERREKFRGVLLTHGHEDHIGAVGHLLERVRVPVYGTRFTIALLGDRLQHREFPGRDLLRTVTPGIAVELGNIRAEYARVSHSIPDACAIAVDTPGGRIVHTGDFNLDPEPVAGRRADLETLGRWGQGGVDLLCCDSTNARVPEATPSEQRVAEGFSALFPQVVGRLYVTQFSSNVGRMQQVVESSRSCRRQVTPLGRALTRCSRIARQYGYLQTAPGDWIAEPRSRGLPRSALTVLCGGSQGEPGSALWRIARGLEPHHRLRPGDAVVFSSRIIPGNEVSVRRLVNRCVAAGARVYLGARDGVHVSGHPGAADVIRVLDRLQPCHLLPVHGDLYQRKGVLELAGSRGYATDQLLLPGNGRRVFLEQGRARLGEALPGERICVQGDRRWDLDDPVFPARRRMGEAGSVMAYVQWSSQGTGRVHVVLSAVCGEGDRAALQQKAQKSVRAELATWSRRRKPEEWADPGTWNALRLTAGKKLAGFLRREGLGRPWVEVEVEETEGTNGPEARAGRR